MIPVVQALTRRHDAFVVKTCVTAQHREMLDQVLDLFGITPDYDLNVMQAGQTLTELAATIIRGLTPVLEAEKPDWVLVQGDTTTTMAASLTAFYLRIPVGHVEAGLRTYNKQHPFPEEGNRRITGVLADIHFAPTQQAAEHLLAEGVLPETVVVTGNTVIDALYAVASLPYDPAGTPLADVPFDSRRIIAVTAHRRENFGYPMEEICIALRSIADRHPDVHLVWPVHLNPNVRKPVYRFLGDLPNVTLLSPLEYQPLVWLLKQCSFVITDSGGLQEEAPGLGKPVLVLRETTERPEGVTAGTVRLVGPNRAELLTWATRLLSDDEAYKTMAHAVNPYGTGHASEHIARVLAGLLPLPHDVENIAITPDRSNDPVASRTPVVAMPSRRFEVITGEKLGDVHVNNA